MIESVKISGCHDCFALKKLTTSHLTEYTLNCGIDKNLKGNLYKALRNQTFPVGCPLLNSNFKIEIKHKIRIEKCKL